MFQTVQEEFWAGGFGDAYVDRNGGPALISANTALFARILSRCRDVASVFEIGANVGLNLRAIRTLLPSAELAAVEINAKAYAELSRIPGVDARHGSAFELKCDRTYDFVFTKGVLIHIHPDRLIEIYGKLVALSRRYVMVCEYYNPKPVSVDYRGEKERLFKRDFAGEMMDTFDLRLIDYGFVYHRDPHFPIDDCTWFLMEKA